MSSTFTTIERSDEDHLARVLDNWVYIENGMLSPESYCNKAIKHLGGTITYPESHPTL